jgi:RimJ/RimL family protein N-acetyltransferase
MGAEAEGLTEVIAETARLRLRMWGEGDGDRFYAVMNTPAVMRHLGGMQDKASWDAAVERLHGYQRDFGHTFWLVERKRDGELLGFCGLKRVNSPGTDLTGQFEIGWRLRESAWGQGYAKEAAIATLDLAFGRYGAPHVVALTIGSNIASQGLMKRLGMVRREDLDFIDTRFGPKMNPSIVYRINSEDWPAARAAAVASLPR